jgi:[acyl-carrier-protein] S-malonyltransferase
MSVAFVFPGQGSQYVGMGKALADAYPVARETLAAADEALGRDLTRVFFDGPEEELRITRNTQPAILAVSVACLRVVHQVVGVSPTAVAGHSLGEYSALVAAGAVDFADALRVVEKRGQFMQEAVPLGTGAMAAVLGLNLEDVAQICAEVSGEGSVVEVANDNCPGQVAISGHAEAVAEAGRRAKKAGAKRAMPLAVSAPFHCSLMAPAGERLARALTEIRVSGTQMPVVANVDAQTYQEAGEIPGRLVRQVSQPVQWRQSVLALGEMGVDRFVEVGPSKVLLGLVRRILPEAALANAEDPASVEKLAGGV